MAVEGLRSKFVKVAPGDVAVLSGAATDVILVLSLVINALTCVSTIEGSSYRNSLE